MQTPAIGPRHSPEPLSPTHHIACVSFLNSKPLIDPLVGRDNVQVQFAVPSKLLDLIEDGAVSAALLSAVDFQFSTHDLLLIPAGMIGCDGPTLTVRIFSKVPPSQIKTLHGDTDSHTSIMLAQVLLRERYGITPAVEPFKTDHANAAKVTPETMLLIGDKVVNAAPDPRDYPYQLDLGEEWKHLTGLPFVFAMWMMRKDKISTDLARLLADAQQRGSAMTDELLDRHCADHGWPRDLARRYFTEYLRYKVTPRDRQGLAQFFKLAATLGILTIRRPIEYLELG